MLGQREEIHITTHSALPDVSTISKLARDWNLAHFCSHCSFVSYLSAACQSLDSRYLAPLKASLWRSHSSVNLNMSVVRGSPTESRGCQRVLAQARHVFQRHALFGCAPSARGAPSAVRDSARDHANGSRGALLRWPWEIVIFQVKLIIFFLGNRVKKLPILDRLFRTLCSASSRPRWPAGSRITWEKSTKKP